MTRIGRGALASSLLVAAIGIGSTASTRAAAQPAPDRDAPIAADAAEAGAARESAGWEPRLNLGIGVLLQAQKGSASIPTATGSTSLEDSADSIISPHFGLGLDLLTPLELSIPTRPRLVMTSSVQFPISRSLISNRVGLQFDSGDSEFSENCPAQVGGANASTCNIRLRSQTSIDYLWTAGIAIDFTLPFDEEQFHFAQGFEYIGMAVQAEGEFQRRSTAPLGDPRTESEFLTAKGDLELFHGISLVETFSVDAYEQGPMMFGFFLQGRLSWFSTDRDPSVSERTDRGRFNFVSSLNDPEPIQYQIMGGVSVRFDPW
ncbi:MAG: hypothetical protein R3F21_04760 [Myxococcota bacterium]